MALKLFYKLLGGEIMKIDDIEYENTETLKVTDAATLMHKNPCFIRQGLIDKRFGFGYAVFNNGRWNFYINKQKFFDETGIKPCRATEQD